MSLRSEAGKPQIYYRRVRWFSSRASGPRRQGPVCASPVILGASYRAFGAQHPDLGDPVYRSIRWRPRRGTRILGRVSERASALVVASYWLASGFSREPASSACNLLIFPSVDTTRPRDKVLRPHGRST